MLASVRRCATRQQSLWVSAALRGHLNKHAGIIALRHATTTTTAATTGTVASQRTTSVPSPPDAQTAITTTAHERPLATSASEGSEVPPPPTTHDARNDDQDLFNTCHTLTRLLGFALNIGRLVLVGEQGAGQLARQTDHTQ
jgi:hypothetical protein